MAKRAVVVGINDYSVQGFNNLGGCINDANATYHMLVDAFGFDPSQTWLYTDKTATSANLRRALNYMLQISEPGDVACLYYAGHGGLHPFTDAVYYQTIIPYSGRFISDFDLYQAAEALRPSEVNFTVILDSCHSGGMHDESEHPNASRAISYATSLVQKMVQSMQVIVPFGMAVNDPNVFDRNVRNVRAVGSHGITCEEDSGQKFVSKAKTTLLAACAWNQFAGEGNGHGFFTKAMLESVNQCNFETDHVAFQELLFKRTRELSKDCQTVQIRGQENRMSDNFLAGFTSSK
jgi:Caspase domain